MIQIWADYGTAQAARRGIALVPADRRHQGLLLDRSVELPAGTAEAVKVALAGSPFTPADLPGLDPDEQLTLARRLVREGLLVRG